MSGCAACARRGVENVDWRCSSAAGRPGGENLLAGYRRRGRGIESAERGRVDAVIAGLLFMAGMRRSEVSALR